MSAYCTIADVFRWIPPSTVQNRARLVSSVVASTDTLTVDQHGLEENSPVSFRAEAGGSLPGGIVAGTTYYADRLTDSTFKPLDAVGGSTVNITTTGENVVMIIELPWDAWITEASNEIECTIPAEGVPLESPYPAIIIAYTAGLVAEKALAYCGVTSIGLTDRMKNTRSQFALWLKGIPIRGCSNQTASNLAISSTAISTDSRGWVPSEGDGFLP